MTTPRSLRLCGGIAALALLAACGSGRDDLLRQVGSQLLERTRTSPAEIAQMQQIANAAVVADPDSLRNFPAPILLFSVEETNTLAVIGVQTDDGTDSLWFSADDKSVAFRDGVIVATRGLVRDMQSTDEPDIRTTRGNAVRDLYYRMGDESIQRFRFYCQITDRGPSGAEVLDRIYPARLVTEACSDGDTEFTNAYWIGNTGEIRRSRQWISPEVGYVAVQKVQD